MGIASIKALSLVPVQSFQPMSSQSQLGMPQSSSGEPLAWRNLCHVCIILYAFLTAVCSLLYLHHGNA